MMKVLLKPSDIAPLLGVTTARVYQMVDAGTLPFVRLGRGIRVPKQAWDRWLDDQSSKALASIKQDGEINNDKQSN